MSTTYLLITIPSETLDPLETARFKARSSTPRMLQGKAEDLNWAQHVRHQLCLEVDSDGPSLIYKEIEDAGAVGAQPTITIAQIQPPDFCATC